MKTFVFTYDRYDTITTSEYLKNIPHYVLCHEDAAKQKFISAGRIHGELIATNQPKGLSNNRNFALDMLAPGEWACFWVDDLIETTCITGYDHYRYMEQLGVNMDNQPVWRELMKAPCSAERFYHVADSTILHAELKGFKLCGFSLTDNPLFRDKHYSYWSLADGRCWLIKKTHLRFDSNVQLIDDTYFTALNLKTFGGVVVNNWLLPKCKRYTAGAFGTMAQRMQQKIQEAKYLVEYFPEYICYGDKVGWPAGSHVKIRQKKININQQNLFE